MRLRATMFLLLGTLVLGGSGAAAAATPKLWLVRPSTSARGVAGEAAINGFAFEPVFETQCSSSGQGELMKNGKAADALAFSHISGGACEELATNLNPGYLLQGGVSRIVLRSDGTAQLTASPKILLGEPGWCVYELRKFAGVFSLTFSPHAVIVGRATATLNKRYTLAAACAETQSWEFRDEARANSIENPYALEVLA
jgi:hypothetical protein